MLLIYQIRFFHQTFNMKPFVERNSSLPIYSDDPYVDFASNILEASNISHEGNTHLVDTNRRLIMKFNSNGQVIWKANRISKIREAKLSSLGLLIQSSRSTNRKQEEAKLVRVHMSDPHVDSLVRTTASFFP